MEALAPLFHLLNGDLCYADKETISSSGETTSGVGRRPAGTRGVAGLRPQRPALGSQPALDAVHRQPRGGARQRPLRLQLVQHPVHVARQRLQPFQGSYYSFQVGLGAVHQPRRQRRLLPGRGRLQRAASPPPPTPRATRSRRPPTSTTSSTPVPSRRTPTAPSLPVGPRPTRRPPGSRPPWPRRVPTPPSTGSSSRCTSAPSRRRPTTAATPVSARPGYRCSTSTRWTWC